jgi:diguanylate cyclase (GGDEF)-like protein
VFRYGGDEFVFALAVNLPEDAACFFKRIEEEVRSVDLRSSENEKIPMSCCIGYALFKGNYGTFPSALKSANEAIRATKKIGRGNIVSVAPQNKIIT